MSLFLQHARPKLQCSQPRASQLQRASTCQVHSVPSLHHMFTTISHNTEGVKHSRCVIIWHCYPSPSNFPEKMVPNVPTYSKSHHRDSSTPSPKHLAMASGVLGPRPSSLSKPSIPALTAELIDLVSSLFGRGFVESTLSAPGPVHWLNSQ